MPSWHSTACALPPRAGGSPLRLLGRGPKVENMFWVTELWTWQLAAPPAMQCPLCPAKLWCAGC